MNNIEDKFINKAIYRSGITLYSKIDTLEFIKECKRLNIVLLGIDGFKLTESTTQPSLDDSIDFSSIFNSKNVYERALNFIESRNNDLYFEVVYELRSP